MRSVYRCRPRLRVAAASTASQQLHALQLHLALLSCCPAPRVPCCSDLMNVQLGGQLPLDAGLWSELRSLQVGGPRVGCRATVAWELKPPAASTGSRVQLALVGQEAQRTGALQREPEPVPHRPRRLGDERARCVFR